jgi:hypothetical protein
VAYLPLSLSFDGVELFDMLSDGDGVVLDEELLEAGALGVILLELDVLPDGAVVVADDDVPVDGVSGVVEELLEVDGVIVLGVVVVVVELDVAGVPEGVVVDDVLLVSR